MKAQFESVIPLESNSFKAFIQEKAEFDAPYHYHPEYELTYILSSHGIRFVGNEFENFTENDLVFLGPNLPHCWKNKEKQDLPASAIVIQWKENFLAKDWLDTKEFYRIKQVHQLSHRGIKFSNEVALQIKEQLINILDLDVFQRLVTLLNILDQLSKTSDYTLICNEGFSYTSNNIHNDRINDIYQYVKANYNKKITLENIASKMCMTEESFSRFFSKTMNKTFFSFLNEYRINMACQLLIETDMSVVQVCYRAGYESMPFFYRQFKKFKKCSPRSFRQHYKLK